MEREAIELAPRSPLYLCSSVSIRGYVLYHIGLKNSYVMPDAHRTEPHVKVGERYPEQTHPRPEHVPAIEAAHATIRPLAQRRFGEPVDATANQMAKRVAAEGVTAEQNHIDCQHNRSETNAEGGLAGRRVAEPHRFPDIVRKENQEDEREIHKVTVNVLHNKREGIL